MTNPAIAFARRRVAIAVFLGFVPAFQLEVFPQAASAQQSYTRCHASPLDVDCTLQESDITGVIGSSVPLNVGVDPKWNDAGAFADWGGCPFMRPPTPPMVSSYLQPK